jgi:hypothetical protein
MCMVLGKGGAHPPEALNHYLLDAMGGPFKKSTKGGRRVIQTEFAMRAAKILQKEGYTKAEALKGAWNILKALEEELGYNTLMLGFLKCCPICMRSDWLVETEDQRTCLDCGVTAPMVKLDELNKNIYYKIESKGL